MKLPIHPVEGPDESEPTVPLEMDLEVKVGLEVKLMRKVVLKVPRHDLTAVLNKELGLDSGPSVRNIPSTVLEWLSALFVSNSPGVVVKVRKWDPLPGGRGDVSRN